MNNLKLFFAGDVVIDTNTTAMSVGEKLKSVISGCDLVSCNYEAPIKALNAVAISKAGPSLYQQSNSIDALRAAGFNFFNLANNHILDYGGQSCATTIKELKDDASAGAGTFDECYSFKLLNIKGVRVALLSLAEWGFGILDDEQDNDKSIGYAWINHPRVEELVKSARKEAEIVIAQLHGGVEDIWIPWPEWRTTYRKMIDWGCDMIIGHHPHVPQGHELYKGKQIFYSLGNFYFDLPGDHPYWNKGFCVEVDIANNQIASATTHWTEKKGTSIDIVTNDEYMKFERELCSYLSKPKYTAMIEEYTQTLWTERYSIYYNASFNTLTRTQRISQNIKSLAKYLLGRDSTRNELLLHNLAIESHRYVVERYLKTTWRKNSHLAQ